MPPLISPETKQLLDSVEKAENPPWIKYVAMLTGVLAGLAGYLTVRSAALSNEAIYQSNQAVLHQAQASDKWAEYQANSIKARMLETQLLIGVADATAKASITADVQKFRTEQPELANEAKNEEHLREVGLAGGHLRLAEKDTIAYASMAFQLGIALASVAALTKRKSVFGIGLFCGAMGLLVLVYSFVIYHFHPAA